MSFMKESPSNNSKAMKISEMKIGLNSVATTATNQKLMGEAFLLGSPGIKITVLRPKN